MSENHWYYPKEQIALGKQEEEVQRPIKDRAAVCNQWQEGLALHNGQAQIGIDHV